MATASLTKAFPIGFWHSLARCYERLETTERGYVWLSKLGPAYLFGLVASIKAWALSRSLPLLLGGTADTSLWLVAAHQAAGMVFLGLVAAMFIARKRPIERVGSPTRGLIALLGCYVMLPVALGGAASDSSAVLLLADVLMVVGLLGAAASLASLGRCFGIFPEARGLVTHGPYRQVRHPMYLFEFVAFLGVLLPSFSPLNALLYTIFVCCQLSRMVFEEQVLERVFPSSYPAYRTRTARLIPGVY
jgi:protein-S-isoprenylcysteine O-methyltransferase Ste14